MVAVFFRAGKSRRFIGKIVPDFPGISIEDLDRSLLVYRDFVRDSQQTVVVGELNGTWFPASLNGPKQIARTDGPNANGMITADCHDQIPGVRDGCFLN